MARTKVEVRRYDPELHAVGTSSHDGNCAWGGKGRCDKAPEFTVTSSESRLGWYSACADHVAGAIKFGLAGGTGEDGDGA
jgi:hypothetical protein